MTGKIIICCVVDVFLSLFTAIPDRMIMYCVCYRWLHLYFTAIADRIIPTCARHHFTVITDGMTTYCACYRWRYHYFAAITDRVATCFVCYKCFTLLRVVLSSVTTGPYSHRTLILALICFETALFPQQSLSWKHMRTGWRLCGQNINERVNRVMVITSVAGYIRIGNWCIIVGICCICFIP
jgi:hypothetical protein